jgi:hypothetical protein
MLTTGTTRHQWGPAPSGSTRHLSVCRRCGLREVTDWYVVPGGRAVELTAWLTPTGTVLGVRPVDTHQQPGPFDALEVLDGVTGPPPAEAIGRCPGHPDAWEPAGERLAP